MWTNVFFLETIPKHICCCVKVQLKVVRKDGVLRYTAWTKKSGWDTTKIKGTEVAEVLAHVTCLGSSHPIILSPYPKRIQNWNSFHTVFRDEVQLVILEVYLCFDPGQRKDVKCQSLYIMNFFFRIFENNNLTSLSPGVTPILLQKAQSCWYLTSNQLRSPWPKIHWKLTENCFLLFGGPQSVWGRQTPHTNIQQYAVGTTNLTYLQPPPASDDSSPHHGASHVGHDVLAQPAIRLSSMGHPLSMALPNWPDVTSQVVMVLMVVVVVYWQFPYLFILDSLRKHVGNKERLKKNTYVTYVLFTLTRFECEFGLQYWSHSFGCGKYSRISKVCIIHYWLYWLPACKSFFLEGCLS